MPFFLEKLGVKLIKFAPGFDDPFYLPVDPLPKPKVPSISPLGFEICPIALPEQCNSDSFDPASVLVRTAVFKSFSRIGLYVEDTKTLIQVKLNVDNDNNLLITVPSVNNLCSKMHIEDISPIQTDICNHDTLECVEKHFDADVLLVEPNDYLQCSKDDAMFRVNNSFLYISRGNKWLKLSIRLSLPDDFYTLNLGNF